MQTPARPRPGDPIGERLREAAALMLCELEAVRLDPATPFTLASGNRSPIYVNCRQVISDPAFMALFTAVSRRLLEKAGARVEVVAGGETAGIPFAAFLARELGVPMLYVRKQAKGHGIAAKVEGRVPAGSQVLLVEDLVTDGGSKLGFLEALREAGLRVDHALVLFDRQQGGTETLARHGVHLLAVTDRTAVLGAAHASGWLSAAERAVVEAYFHDPAGWHAERGLPYQA